LLLLYVIPLCARSSPRVGDPSITSCDLGLYDRIVARPDERGLELDEFATEESDLVRSCAYGAW
jgi:hypothetical protein